MSVLQPYSFEPKRLEPCTDAEQLSSSDSEGNDQEEDRRTSLQWCRCSQCGIMPTQDECICCVELSQVSSMCAAKGVLCVTSHQSFERVVLDKDVLWTAMVAMKDMRGVPVEEPVSNRAYRLAAYRQFTWWVHRRLGRGIRRVIPACAVLRIRKEFPSPDGQYTGFEFSDY